MTNIVEPFGGYTSAQANPDLAQIKLFGCTVVDFNVSADWSSQGGSLSCKLIEDDSYGDRLEIPVLGSPVVFELKTQSTQETIFQYVGIVDSFSRSSSNSKTYSVNISSPLMILESTQVILDGYTGMGASIEGRFNTTLGTIDFGHNNSLIDVTDLSPGVYKWRNISNLINVFGILENDHLQYRVPTSVNLQGKPLGYGGFGFSAKSQDGIPISKAMWALHAGINHVPPISNNDRQRVHGGNLLFGRHDYGFTDSVPYYYHFDALGFYAQVAQKLAAQTGENGDQYRISGQSTNLKEIIAKVCNDANLDYYTYIDIYTDPTIGNPTLAEDDPNWTKAAICNWGLNPAKFTSGGKYGGTIRVQIVDKNAFINTNRPFSNIAYQLIGLEVPDINDSLWAGYHSSGIHPGRRPVNETRFGILSDNQSYSEPLDSIGLDGNSDNGFTQVGTESIAEGGSFPITEDIFDYNKIINQRRITSSDVSIKLNDFTTMKVITGGYQSRIVDVPGNMLRHYWGDIILPNGIDTREVVDTETDELGLNNTATKKIPVVTQLLNPKDVDDYILIDMKSVLGPYSCDGVVRHGIYAASMLEVRCAMTSYESWKAFMDKYKYEKIRRLVACFYPAVGSLNPFKQKQEKSTSEFNEEGGLGYEGASYKKGYGNAYSETGDGDTNVEKLNQANDEQGAPKDTPNQDSNAYGLGINLRYAACLAQINKFLLPAIFEKVKEIGDTHYGKSWYAPVPYHQTAQDLDGNNLVGNFKRSWELTDSAYVEPSTFYARSIPQSNTFVSDGKVSAFVNYDHNFVATNGPYDKSYSNDITSLVGQNIVFNFSEYTLDQLCVTKYPVDIEGNGIIDRYDNIIHAAAQNIESTYSYLPFSYDTLYNRAALPFSDIITGKKLRYVDTRSPDETAPKKEGQEGTDKAEETNENSSVRTSPANAPECPGGDGQLPEASGYFDYEVQNNIPAVTNSAWLNTTVDGLIGLNYDDNGRFSFPFVKFSTSRVFLPPEKPGLPLSIHPVVNTSGCVVAPPIIPKQSLITEDRVISILNPYAACAVPRSFHYPQRSTRYIYGPWMTSLNHMQFRGKIEYEQDESLVPENFLIPINFGPFGSYSLSQVSGFAGMNLAAQGRANAIDNFSLFAVEEGSITIPGGPMIKRIGDSIFGLQQVTDVKVSVNSNSIETTYSFKTISPRFGKNTRDLEKKLTKISNDIKKLKLR